MKYSATKKATMIALLSTVPLTVVLPPVTAAPVTPSSARAQSPTKHTLAKKSNVSNASVQPVAVLPFDFDNKHIMVKVKVGDHAEPFLFAVDSGASMSVINTDTANQLGMRLRDMPIMSILGIKVRMHLRATGYGEKGYVVKSAERVRLHVASEAEDVIPTQSTYAVTSLPRMRSGQSIDGILGYDFLKKYAVAIDYVNQKLSLYNKKDYRYSGKGQWLALDSSDDQLFVRATIKPVGGQPLPVRILLDTGDGGSIIFHTDFANRKKLLNTTTSFPFSGTGPAGTISGRVGYLENLAIAGFTFPHLPAEFLQSKGGAAGDKRYEGGLGNTILSRFNVVMDFEGGYLYLEPNSDFAKPFDPVIYTGLNTDVIHDGWLIPSVDAGSPAASAGFLPGDILLAIDNVCIAGMSAKTYTMHFKNQSVHHYLVRRADKEITLDMQGTAL